MEVESPTARGASNDDFFRSFEDFIQENGITIDRPKGSAHPRFPEWIYPINYGYINGTKSQDGGGIDVYQGDADTVGVIGVICIVDAMKKDSEIKVLYNCTEENIETALKMSNKGKMHGLLVLREAHAE
jgi:inorganic pyrophosphatase